ncbi:Hypothetical predicted protein, partial [Pelobates cultripes]
QTPKAPPTHPAHLSTPHLRTNITPHSKTQKDISPQYNHRDKTQTDNQTDFTPPTERLTRTGETYKPPKYPKLANPHHKYHNTPRGETKQGERNEHDTQGTSNH